MIINSRFHKLSTLSNIFLMSESWTSKNTKLENHTVIENVVPVVEHRGNRRVCRSVERTGRFRRTYTFNLGLRHSETNVSDESVSSISQSLKFSIHFLNKSIKLLCILYLFMV